MYLLTFCVFYIVDAIYEVNVNSMTSDEVHELGSTATFHCSISPPPTIIPPSSLTYYWTIPGVSKRRRSSKSSYYIGHRYQKLNVIHCEVWDRYLLGTGYILFKVNSKVFKQNLI